MSIANVARTDARTSFCPDEALRWAQRYLDAGTDILFVESPESEEEMCAICARFDVSMLVNVVEAGRTPVLSAGDYAEIGSSPPSFPAPGSWRLSPKKPRPGTRILRCSSPVDNST